MVTVSNVIARIVVSFDTHFDARVVIVDTRCKPIQSGAGLA